METSTKTITIKTNPDNSIEFNWQGYNNDSAVLVDLLTALVGRLLRIGLTKPDIIKLTKLTTSKFKPREDETHA